MEHRTPQDYPPPPRSREIQLRLKRLIDVVSAAVLLVFLHPLLLIIMLSIKLDDGGPVFFRQARLGKAGRCFRIWKFRTMVVDADRLLAPDGRVLGNRITRVGRLLRFLSLDELPQLINVLQGEMSLIGPRPVLTSYLERYTPTQRERLAMRPGMTGLAQIHGRNTLPLSKRIEYDIQYIQTFSLLLDLKILLRTLKIVFLREGIVLDRNPAQLDDLARK